MMSSEPEPKWKRSLSEVVQMVWEINREYKAVAKQVGQDPKPPTPADFTQIERRTLIRTAFAVIEGFVFAMKTGVSTKMDRTGITHGEQQYLEEVNYELNSDGALRESAARIPFLTNVRFMFRTYAKAFALDYQLPVDGSGWQALQRAVKVRDRLTHPKTITQLRVSDDDFRDVVEAKQWLEGEITRMVEMLKETDGATG